MSTPSISAPSSLSHRMTSRRPRSPQSATWVVMSVTCCGAFAVREASARRDTRKISPTVVRSSPCSAITEPSLERSAVMIISGVSASSDTSPVSGSSRKRWRAVRCDATKRTPSSVQATGAGFSSKSAVRMRGWPPPASITASSVLP